MIAAKNVTRKRGLKGLLAISLVATMLGVVQVGIAQGDPVPLSIAMTATPNPVASGESLTYAITVTNNEPNVMNVRLTDQLNGLENIVLTSTRGYCFESNLLVTCDAGSMPGHGSTWTVLIRGLVTAGDGEVLNNTATVVGRKSSQDFSVPTTTSVLVGNAPSGPRPELGVSIAAPAQANAGDLVTYNLTVNNAGGANATDLNVTVTLPPGFGAGPPATTAVGTSLFECDTASLPVITCVGGAVDAGANATITIQATAAGTPDRYTTTAVVDPEDAVAENDELNNTASHELLVPAAPPPSEPVTFMKSGPTQIRVGDVLTYSIKVTNTSPKYSADRLSVTDGTQGLDAASVTVTSSDPKLICVPSASLVDCRGSNNNYRLLNGASVHITISGRVVATPGTVINNTATLQTIQNKISITRTSSVSTTVRPGVDLTVTQFATCAGLPGGSAPDDPWGNCPFRARDQFNYVLTVGNSGLDDAVGVRVREPLPPDVIFEGYSDSNGAGFVCTASGGVVTCSGGTVRGQLSSGQYAGTTRRIVLHLTAPNSVGPITATATVDPFNAIHEGDENNNTFTTTTQILTGVELTIQQAVNFDPVAPSGTLVYTIIVQNIGTQDAAGIRISDILPAGSRFRWAKEIPNITHFPFAPPHGFTCAGASDDGRVHCTEGRLFGTYAFNGGPPWMPPALTDTVMIEVGLFAPAPFGATPRATAATILNQALVDPNHAIPEIDENNDLNILETFVDIPPTKGDWGTFNELTVKNEQSNPAAGAVAPNGTLEYTLTVSNWGSDPVANFTVYDYIPQGARFRDATASALSGGSGGFTCSFNAGLVSCIGGALASAPAVGSPSSATIKIKLFAPDTPNDQTSNYTNHALIDPNNAIPEADETNNVSDVPLVVDLPPSGQNAYNQLTITNVQAAPTTTPPGPNVAPDGTLVYRLTIGNTGTDRATGVVVRDFLPAGSRFRSARNNTTLSSAGSGGFACSHSDGVVQCVGGTLLGGGMAVIDITLFAPSQPGTIDNQAFVDPDNSIPEGNEQDNMASVETMVALGGANKFFDLQVNKLESDPTSVATDTAMKYKLEVKNDGSDQAFNISLVDRLPAGTTFVSAVDDAPGSGAFTCSEGGGSVTCSGGSIAGGATRSLTIVVRSPGHDDVTLVDNKTEITNEVLLDPGNDIPEGDETNNSAYVTTTVLAKLDLSVGNDGNGCGGSSGSECDWTFSVTNGGPDPVTGVTVVTDLPVGVIPLDVEGPAGWACQINENPINHVVCTRPGTFAAGGPESFMVRVYVTANSGNAISSTTIVDPDDVIVETDEANNTASDSQSA